MNRFEAERRGRKGEGLAAWWLRLLGWRIVARRVKTPRGEIDLIARRGRPVAFALWNRNRDYLIIKAPFVYCSLGASVAFCSKCILFFPGNAAA